MPDPAPVMTTTLSFSSMSANGTRPRRRSTIQAGVLEDARVVTAVVGFASARVSDLRRVPHVLTFAAGPVTKSLRSALRVMVQ